MIHHLCQEHAQNAFMYWPTKGEFWMPIWQYNRFFDLWSHPRACYDYWIWWHISRGVQLLYASHRCVRLSFFNGDVTHVSISLWWGMVYIAISYRHVYQWVKDIVVQMMMIRKNHDVKVVTQENQVIIARVSNLSLSTLLVIESCVSKTGWPLMYFICVHLMPMNLCQKSWHSSSCKILLYHQVI